MGIHSLVFPLTPQVLHLCLVHTNMNVKNALQERGAYLSINELLEPMKLMYQSLLATGDESVSQTSRLYPFNATPLLLLGTFICQL